MLFEIQKRHTTGMYEEIRVFRSLQQEATDKRPIVFRRLQSIV